MGGGSAESEKWKMSKGWLVSIQAISQLVMTGVRMLSSWTLGDRGSVLPNYISKEWLSVLERHFGDDIESLSIRKLFMECIPWPDTVQEFWEQKRPPVARILEKGKWGGRKLTIDSMGSLITMYRC